MYASRSALVDVLQNELEEVVAYLRDPHKFTTLGGKAAQGYPAGGPPWHRPCWPQTMLARAIAGMHCPAASLLPPDTFFNDMLLPVAMIHVLLSRLAVLSS